MQGISTHSLQSATLALSSGYLLGLGPGTDKNVTAIKGWFEPAKTRRPGKAERVHAHGIFSQRGWKDARYPSVSGAYRAPDRTAAGLYVDELAAYLAEGTEGILEVDDASLGIRRATVYVIDVDITWTGGVDVLFTINLEAPDPRKYGNPDTRTTGIATPGGGLQFDLFAGAPYTEARRNLIENPSFETGQGQFAGTNAANNWLASGGVFGPGRAGLTSLAAGLVRGAFPVVNVTPGEVFTFSVYVRTSAARNCRLMFDYNSGATYLSAVFSPVIAVPVGAWVRLDLTGTVPAGADNIRPFVRMENAAAAGEALTVDGALLERSATLGAYFDGDTAPTDAAVYSWTGTPHASASVQSSRDGASGVLDFGVAGNPGTVTIDNPGKAPTDPIVRVTGYVPPTGFTITEQETGRRLVYADVVPANVTLELNSVTGAVTIDGQDRSRNLIVSEWPQIPESSSRTYLFESLGADSSMSVEATPAWW